MVKNIKTGQFHRTHSLVKTKLDENYLRDLNKQANSEENYIVVTTNSIYIIYNI